MTSSEPASASKGPRYAPPDPTLPKPWRALVDGNTGYLYFWNPETKVTQYKRPVAAAPPSPPQPPGYSRPEERTRSSAPSEGRCFQVISSPPMPEDPNLKGKTVAEETVAPSIAANLEHSGCPSNFYMSIGDGEVIEDADDPDATLDENPEASTAYAPDAAPRRTRHAVKKVSATRVHKDASQKETTRTTQVVNPVEDHIPYDTEEVNLRKRKLSKSSSAGSTQSRSARQKHTYAPDAAPRRTRLAVKKVSATRVHKDASQKETTRTTQVVNPVEDHIPSDTEVNLRKRKLSKNLSAGGTQSRSVPQKPSGASGLPPRKEFAKKRKKFAQSSTDEPTTAKDTEGTTRQEKLSAGNQSGEVPKQPAGTITEQTTREDDDQVLDDLGFVPDTATRPPSPKETARLGGENPKVSMVEPGDSLAVDKISTNIAAIEQSALLATSSSLQVKKYGDKQLAEPVPKTDMELPGPVQDFLRVYDRVTELEKQLAEANTRDKEREELMVQLSKSFNEQNRQYEQLVKERDDAVAESLRLKGQLETQKTAYEVISKDLDMSYKLLAGAQSLFAKYQNLAWETKVQYMNKVESLTASREKGPGELATKKAELEVLNSDRTCRGTLGSSCEAWRADH